MVLSVDEGVGRIVEVLRETGVIDETLIVFSTDNGGMPFVGSGCARHRVDISIRLGRGILDSLNPFHNFKLTNDESNRDLGA